jgi:Flp pilus assembly protein TadG
MLMRLNRIHLSRERGMAVMLTALMLTFIIPLVGLAIDGSMLYAVKARMSTASDAAALAAARSLSVGRDFSEQAAEAEETARRFFDANFPPGAMNTANRSVTVQVAESSYRTRTVTVGVQLDSPLYFMRILGASNSTIKAEGKASRRDVNVMLVLDRSGSLDEAGACDDLRAASTDFTEQFAATRDKVGLLTYGGGFKVDYAPNVNFKSGSSNVLTKIAAINCTGWTNSAAALWEGYQRIVALGEPGALNVILFFTDGMPNTMVLDLPVKTEYTSYSPTGLSTCRDSMGRSNSHYLWNPQPKRGTVSGDAATSPEGIRKWDAGSIPVSSDPGDIDDKAGCYFDANRQDIEKDIAHLPATDIWGNSLSGYKTVSRYGSGPYAGEIKVSSGTTMANAAANALDSAASRIRGDTNLNPVIFSIGLGGAGAAEDILLQRVSNDPASPIFNTSRPEGLYVYAPSAAELNQAFSRIASEILRLSR